MYLNELAYDHKLRNTPLIEINAWYSNAGGVWREVFPNFGIAKCTYNDLTSVWTHNHLWESRMWDEEKIDQIGQNGNIGYEI
jgi:hypothetical protein